MYPMTPPITLVITSVMSEERPFLRRSWRSSMPKLSKNVQRVVLRRLGLRFLTRGSRKPKGMVMMILRVIWRAKSPRL